ncbi:FGGY-family carbohydrate kinase [Micromonospora siamensis]|uniref:Xylulokinase n=1 Tax=Micromonospora siamensis TaxID=299152 RepID=A0A1C5IMK4_9ACTN|nr:FGGY-family carbohydrate kinase [Micromonospora siamensis]SCG59535.1 xylulokinase [Micromonospora siamensis]
MSDYLIGIDLGTASSKGVLARPDGTIVATATRAHGVSYPRPGWAEVDADAVWWADVVAISRELTAAAAGGRIAGVCVSGVGPCLLLCDDQVRPLRPAILYGIDMRATAEIDELTRRYGADEIVARGGSALSSQAVGPKLLWVRRHEPQVWQRATRWYNSSSFVVARLTGEYVLDQHTASQCDPLYDVSARRWHPEWAADVAPGLRFPELLWPGQVAGTVTGDAAARTGLPAGTPVCAGTVDAWAEAFSAGVRRPGDLMLMYGSTMFFVQVLSAPRTHPLLWTTAGVEPGSYTLAAGMSTSGLLTEWVQRLTGGVPYEQLLAEAEAVPPGADGLLLLPYFAGERTPIFDPAARGVIAGLSLRHGRGHLFRAVYEGIGYGIRQIVDLLDSAGGPAGRIVAVGGGARAGLWTQVVSDITGREQHLPAETIGASYGDALLAAIGTGLVPPDTDWSRVARTVTPDRSRAELYDRLFAGYGTLYPATRDVVHDLAAVQGQPPG